MCGEGDEAAAGSLAPSSDSSFGLGLLYLMYVASNHSPEIAIKTLIQFLRTEKA